MAGTIIPIADLTRQALQSAVAGALEQGAEACSIADLVASVDWSGYAKASPPVIALLGQLEAWTTQVAEDELSADEFRSCLESILPVATSS